MLTLYVPRVRVPLVLRFILFPPAEMPGVANPATVRLSVNPFTIISEFCTHTRTHTHTHTHTHARVHMAVEQRIECRRWNIFLRGRGRDRGGAFHSRKVGNCRNDIERLHRATANRQITFHCRDVITDSGVALVTRWGG
jgi:hypothetical protein